MPSYALLVSSLLLLCNALPEKRAANPTVTIASGVLVGTASRVSNQPSVTGLASAFLGIPYASNPPLRFAPPVAPISWSTPLAVQTNKPICYQQQLQGELGVIDKKNFNNPIGNPDPAESESCLYLSVYAPPTASPTNLKAVMFWIFGGNLQHGGSALNAYNGSSLAVNEDVVVVVPNYRTNIFGFSNSGEIPFGKQNSGFLDQRFALQWVQDNIAKFGGDKNKVTIFGQSAGGHSVKQLLANPPQPVRGYRAAILESQGLALLGDGRKSYDQVAKQFGCPTSAPLSCLRKIKATDIVEYITAQGLQFPPVVGDGTSSGFHTDQNIDNNTFADVPILIGTTLHEASVFERELAISASTSLASGAQKLLSSFSPGLSIGDLDIGSTFPGVDGTYALLDRLGTDLVFTCPSSYLSDKLKDRQNLWRYRYDGDFKNVAVYDNLGAYHFSEVWQVFGTYPLKTQYGSATPTQIALSKYMQHAWASFAKSPDNGPGWRRFNDQIGNVIGILGGENNSVGVSEQSSILTTDYPCIVLKPIHVVAGGAY